MSSYSFQDETVSNFDVPCATSEEDPIAKRLQELEQELDFDEIQPYTPIDRRSKFRLWGAKSEAKTSGVVENITQGAAGIFGTAIEGVDTFKAFAKVSSLQRQYPYETPNEIAHRLIVEKAAWAGGGGLLTALVPGMSLLTAGIDCMMLMSASAELVYQIAAAYGLELESGDRKTEALTIFSVSMCKHLAIKAGFDFLENIPIAGAFINGTSSAATIYALGYGACRFYDARLTGTDLTAKLPMFESVLQAKSEQYLEEAIAQEITVDWLLAYLVLAGNTQMTLRQLLPELQAAQLSPASIDSISRNIQTPPAIHTLLAQLNRDFAIPLLSRCQKIARADGILTPEEEKLIALIAQKAQFTSESVEAIASIDRNADTAKTSEVAVQEKAIEMPKKSRWETEAIEFENPFL